MVKFYLFLTFFLFFILVRAGDTLTVRQVYSYNVGDTLDFKVWRYDIFDMGSLEQIDFEREIVSKKLYNTSGDTLFFSFNGDTIPDLVITNLDSSAIFYGDNDIMENTNGCYLQISSDTTTYPGILSNVLSAGCFESGYSYRFTKGLGETYYYSQDVDLGESQAYYSETLVYYSNGQIRTGTPIEDLDGSNLPFIPLPEECATWTRTINYGGGPPGWDSPPFNVNEQIQTGAKYPHNGHNYVEMLYSDGITNDSLIGYFYNDSMDKKVYFTQQIDSPVQMLCDFSVLEGTTCQGSGVILIDTILVGNQQRAQWYCSLSYGLTNSTIVAGVGPLYGLMKVKHFWGYANVNDYPTPVEIDGQLSCFSVCGQTLYPNDTVANCAVLTSVQRLNTNNTFIGLYPSVNDGKFILNWAGEHSNDYVQIFDLTGGLIRQYEINSTLTTCQMNQFSSGMYLWRAISNGFSVQEGKFIIQ